MRYVYVGGAKGAVMHIQKHTIEGRPIMQALCNIDLDFNRSINAPWALGKKVCKNCTERLKRREG